MSDPVAQSPFMLPPSDGGPSQGQVSPLLLVHRALRGRYLLAITLGLILAVPFGYLGYRLTLPKYRSTGLVRVTPTLPVTLYGTEDQKVPPLFDSLVSTQAAILKTRRVLDRAMLDANLQSSGWPSGPSGVRMLEETLQVTSERNSELIKVTVTHMDARLAQAGLNAVLTAFEEIQEEFSGVNATRREQQLDTLHAQLTSDLRDRREEILRLSLEHGTADLDPVYYGKVEAMSRLEQQLATLDEQIQALEAQEVEAGIAAGEAETPPDEVLAMSDQVLGGLYQELARTDAQIRAMEKDFGPRHPDMVILVRSRDALQEQIDARKRTLLAVRQAGPAGGFDAGIPAGMSLAGLKRLRENTATRLESAKKEFQGLHTARLNIARLKEMESETRRQLDDATARLTQLRVERQNLAQGRVSVVQRGELPSSPSSDRRKVLGLLGAMGGGGMGVAMIAAFGLLRGGYRYIDDVEADSLTVPLLGTIPDLRNKDPEHDEMAALSVHHLRNMLEQSGPRDARAVHAITSGSAGDGKTSLVLALGMSFAVSGHRTLLLDADLVGRRLSRLLELSKAQGLTEAVGKQVLNGEVHQTRVPNLWAIPTGNRADFTPEKLSSADLQRLIQQVRGRFDRVIIDTGPVLGSLEAGLVCPLADRVVLIVSAGQNPKVVQASLRRLQQLGATCAGMVFNRARRDDFGRSVSAAPLSRSIRSVAPRPDEADGTAPTSSLIRALEANRTQGRDGADA